MTNQDSHTVSVNVSNPCDEERILHIVASRRWNLLIPAQATYTIQFQGSDDTPIKIEYTEWNGIHVEGLADSTVAVYYNGKNIIPEILLPASSLNRAAIVKEGTFLYGETVICDVCIVKVNWIQDDEFIYDFPEGQGAHMHIPIDRFEELYSPWYGSSICRGDFIASGGTYPSMEEAMKSVANSPYVGSTLQWAD